MIFYDSSFGDIAVDPINKALQNNQSRLRVFKFGNFSASNINFESSFKTTFSNSPLITCGSITVNTKNPVENVFNKLVVGQYMTQETDPGAILLGDEVPSAHTKEPKLPVDRSIIL